MAFRAIYIHLFVGIDKEFFKDMTALKTPEFKNGHSLSPCNRQSSYMIRPRFEKWIKSGQDSHLTPWIPLAAIAERRCLDPFLPIGRRIRNIAIKQPKVKLTMERLNESHGPR